MEGKAGREAWSTPVQHSKLVFYLPRVRGVPYPYVGPCFSDRLPTLTVETSPRVIFLVLETFNDGPAPQRCHPKQFGLLVLDRLMAC